MPKYFCDYCDTFLTHDSPSVRKSHLEGWKHKAAVRAYYAQFESDVVQDIIDQKIRQHTMGAPGPAPRGPFNQPPSMPMFGGPPPFAGAPPPFAGGPPPRNGPPGPPPFVGGPPPPGQYAPPPHGQKHHTDYDAEFADRRSGGWRPPGRPAPDANPEYQSSPKRAKYEER